MPRNLHPDTEAALSNDELKWIVLLEIVLDSGTVALCTRLKTFEYNSLTYTGVGNIGTIGRVVENLNLEPSKCDVILSGLDPVALAAFLNNDHLGRSITIRYGLLDDSNNLIGEPFLYFDGSMSELDVIYGEECRIKISAADEIADWDRHSPARLTHEDQKERYPDDMGLIFVTNIHRKKLIWQK